MDFFDHILPLWVDRDSGWEFIGVSVHSLEHAIVADQKIRVGLIEPAVLIVYSIHTKDTAFLT
jgi:hypothetical protein